MLAGTLNVQATATNSPTATAGSTNIGLLSGAGATVRATDTSAVHAFIGPVEGTFAADAVGDPTLVETRNDVNVLATLTSNPYSNSSMIGVGVLAGGVGMSSFATAKPRVDAYLGDGAQVFADGNVVFRAVGTVTAIADGEGFSASLGFSVGQISSRADLEPTVRAFTTNRGTVEGDDVTFDARLNVDSGNNPISPTYKGGPVDPAYATLTLGSVAILAGITAGGTTAIDSPNVSTFVAGATTIFSLGTVTVWSQVFSPASADGRSLSIGIGVGVGIVAPTATAAGTVTSEVDGTISEAGAVTIENTVESRTTVIGRSAAGGLLAGVSDATLTANTQASVDARVRGSIRASGNVTVESFVLSSALADYAGIQLSLGFSGGFITANATDSTHAGVEVYGGASITSQFGGIALLAFHNFDGSSTFLTSNTVKAIAQITSAALGAAFNSSNLNATAQANVTSQLDPGGTLDAAGKVTVGAASGNFATASMENASGAIINLGSVGSNPIADAKGHTEANLLGNVVGPGNTAGANSILLAAEGSDSATVSMSNVGGGALSISSSDSTSRGTPNVSSTLGSGGSIVVATGDITGTALSYTGSSSSTSSGTGGALNVNDFSADASMDPTVTFTVNGGSTTTSQFGTVSLGATHNESPNTFASASGGGGGFINVGSGTSGSREHLTISNTVYGVVNGVDVAITTHGNVLVEGHTDNGGGGFVSITNANSNANARADNSVWIAAGAQINASRNADVNASSFLQPYATASSNGGGFVSGVGGSVQATVDYINVATVQGNVTAGNTATVEAHVNVNGTAGGSGDTGGAFTGGGITADVEIGDTDALNQVHLLGGGQVDGDFVVLNAQVDRLRMDAEANVSAGALGASTTANGNVNAFGASEVRLEPGSDVYGNVRIAINATYAGNDLFAAAVASCDCGGGDTEGHVNINDNTDALVSGIAGSVLHTYDLEVNADQSSPGFGWDAESHGALIDVGGISVNGATNFGRDIYWESTVYLAPSPNPEVTVNSNGTVTTLVNASLTDQFGNSYFLGSTFAVGRIIEVGDLVDSGSGIANFSTNDLTGFASFLASHNDDDVHFGAPPVGHIWGNDGVFIVEDAWDSITIMNSSSRTLVTHYIQVENTANPIATITVTVEDIPGPTNSPPNDVSLDEFPPNRATIEFDIQHLFPATVIQILNLQPGATAASNVILDGTIIDPIGTVLVRNDRGSILFGPDVIKADGFVETNRAFFDAPNGSIGSSGGCTAIGIGTSVGIACPPRSPIVLHLVQSQFVDGSGTHERPIQLMAQAGGNIDLDVTNILREPQTAPFAPQLGPIHAGGNVTVRIFDSLQGDDQADLGEVEVDLFHPPGPVGPLVGSGLYRVHFRPDLPLPPDLVAILRAFGTINAPIDSIVTFTDVSAGNNIYLCHGATSCSTDSATTIPFVVSSDVDANLRANMFGWDDNHVMSTEDGAGQIDEYTNGFILDSELNSDLRVGQIFSTGSNVALVSKALILDAANDPGSSGSLDGTDVIGQNITMITGLGGVFGGVGNLANFLEIQVNHLGGTPGVLTVEDTAAPFTLGVYVTQTSGNLWVNTVHTNGSAALTTLAGSILDGRNGGLGNNAPDPNAPGGCCLVPNVVANFVELFAAGGSIGSAGVAGCNNDISFAAVGCAPNSDFKIDSSHLATANVAMAATNGIYVSETHGALNLVLALTINGDIRLTVCDRPTTGDDLNLLANGLALFAEGVILPITKGTIFAVNESVTIRVGDNLTTDPNSQIIAGKTITIIGDYCDCDPGVGSVITLGGTVKSAPVPHVVTTVVLGGVDADTFVFNQTSLVGSTAVYGGLGSDSFVVNQLASMDVTDGDTLTLDGQGAADLYTVNTAGSLSTDAHNYVINVLDSGAPNDGSNVLVVNGTGDPDVFLLRGMSSPSRFTDSAVSLPPCRRPPRSSRCSTGRNRTFSTAHVRTSSGSTTTRGSTAA